MYSGLQLGKSPLFRDSSNAEESDQSRSTFEAWTRLKRMHIGRRQPCPRVVCFRVLEAVVRIENQRARGDIWHSILVVVMLGNGREQNSCLLARWRVVCVQVKLLHPVKRAALG